MATEEMFLVFHGLMLPKETHSLESLKFAQEFNFCDDDVVAAVYPKSGLFIQVTRNVSVFDFFRDKSGFFRWRFSVSEVFF